MKPSINLIEEFDFAKRLEDWNWVRKVTWETRLQKHYRCSKSLNIL